MASTGASGQSEELILGSVAATSRRTISPGVGGVGLRTHALRFENLSTDQFPRPAEEFLLASRMRRWDRETLLSIAGYASDIEVVVRSQMDKEPTGSASVVVLPPPSAVDVGLTTVVASRRSIRSFSGASVEIGGMAAVLRHCASVTAIGEVDLARGGMVDTGLRACPSAGGLYPVQAWVAAMRVDGLPCQVFRYRADLDALSPVGQPNGTMIDNLCSSFDAQDGSVDLDRAAAILLFVARPWRAMRKYGTRGMRFVFHEAGSMAQSAHLTTTALGLGSVDYSGFYDDEANNALDIDGVYEVLVHAVIIGVPC